MTGRYNASGNYSGRLVFLPETRLYINPTTNNNTNNNARNLATSAKVPANPPKPSSAANIARIKKVII